MRGFIGVLLLAAGSAACASLPANPQARTAELDRAPLETMPERDRQTLRSGGLVERPLSFEKDGARYVGGVSYQVVRASPEAVIGALRDPESLATLLPRTQSVTETESADDLRRLEVTQGNDIVQASYTIVVEEGAEPGQMRFWLDRGRPHDIEDVWGYFRVTSAGSDQSLITVGVALNVGPGIVRMLFERHIQQMILATPSHMRTVLEQGTVDDGALARTNVTGR